MRGLFCSTKARNNEEFKIELKKRMKKFAGIGVLGVLTAAAGVIAYYLKPNGHMAATVAGIGTGIVAGMIILWFKTWQILKDDDKIREERLELADERLQEISSRAFRVAGVFMVVTLYIVCLAGGFFYPELIKVLLIVMAVFLLAYTISYKIYQKKI